MSIEEEKEKQKAFKKAAKQLKSKDSKQKLEGIAACKDFTFLKEVWLPAVALGAFLSGDRCSGAFYPHPQYLCTRAGAYSRCLTI